MTFERIKNGRILDRDRNLELGVASAGKGFSSYYFHNVGNKEKVLGGCFSLTLSTRLANEQDGPDIDRVISYLVRSRTFGIRREKFGDQRIAGFSRQETLDIIKEAVTLRTIHSYKNPDLIEKAKRTGREVLFSDSTIAWVKEGE